MKQIDKEFTLKQILDEDNVNSDVNNFIFSVLVGDKKIHLYNYFANKRSYTVKDCYNMRKDELYILLFTEADNILNNIEHDSAPQSQLDTYLSNIESSIYKQTLSKGNENDTNSVFKFRRKEDLYTDIVVKTNKTSIVGNEDAWITLWCRYCSYHVMWMVYLLGDIRFQNTKKWQFLKKVMLDKTDDNPEFAKVKEYYLRQHFPPHIPYDDGRKIMEYLKKEEYIADNTDPESFMYLMGCTNELPSDLRKIVWNSNKQLLRDLIMNAFAGLITSETYTKVSLAKIVPHVFVDKNGQDIVLAKNKKIPSTENEKMIEFIKKMRL